MMVGESEIPEPLTVSPMLMRPVTAVTTKVAEALEAAPVNVAPRLAVLVDPRVAVTDAPVPADVINAPLMYEA